MVRDGAGRGQRPARAHRAPARCRPPRRPPCSGALFAALAHAHERGVVHRDLKPANVLLGADGAQLADFGIAHLEAELLTGPMRHAADRDGGRARHAAVHVARAAAGRRVDRRSDLFSAGVMLYEAATGVLPQGAFAPPSQLNRAYGRAFDRIVMQLLQADPARPPGGGGRGCRGARWRRRWRRAGPPARDRGLGRRARAVARRRNVGDCARCSAATAKAPRRHRRRRWYRTRTRRPDARKAGGAADTRGGQPEPPRHRPIDEDSSDRTTAGKSPRTQDRSTGSC